MPQDSSDSATKPATASHAPAGAARKHGGRRAGAGRKPRPVVKKGVFVSMTDAEKERFQRAAKANGLTLSYYLRDQLGLPIER